VTNLSFLEAGEFC